MTSKDWDKYFRTGVIHALAVSGQHLVVLAGFLGFLLRLGGLPRKTRALLITLVLIGYAFLAGGRPPALRAAWMVAAYTGGTLLGRLVLPANAFALAWLGVIIVQPADIFTSGCPLSFLCVLVLMWALSLFRSLLPGATTHWAMGGRCCPAAFAGHAAWLLAGGWAGSTWRA